MKPQLALLAAGLLAAVGGALYFATHAPAPPPPEPEAVPAVNVTVDLPTRDFLSPLTKARPPASPPPMKLESELLPWEKQILDILQDPTTEGTKGQQILALLPTLPEEALTTATEQALEWLHDPDYTVAVLPLLLNVQTHGAVLAVLYRDLMERPNNLTLPALLSLARTPEHPYSTAAHDNLSLLLGQDLAEDWVAWDSAIKQRLASEPAAQ